MSRHYLMPSLFALAFAVSAHAETVTLSSPDGRNAVTVDSERLTYAINRDGKTVIDPSPLGLNLDIGQIGAGATYDSHTGTSVDTTWNLVVGKTATAPDHYTQSDLAFSWSQYPKPPSKLALENAEIALKVGTFFSQTALGPSK